MHFSQLVIQKLLQASRWLQLWKTLAWAFFFLFGHTYGHTCTVTHTSFHSHICSNTSTQTCSLTAMHSHPPSDAIMLLIDPKNRDTPPCFHLSLPLPVSPSFPPSLSPASSASLSYTQTPIKKIKEKQTNAITTKHMRNSGNSKQDKQNCEDFRFQNYEIQNLKTCFIKEEIKKSLENLSKGWETINIAKQTLKTLKQNF